MGRKRMGGGNSKGNSKKGKTTEENVKGSEKQEKKEERKKPEEFSHQAGGHVGAFLIGGEGKIMKKVGEPEFKFYSTTLGTFDSLKPFAPTFYGTQEKDGNKYVTIEDLTYGYAKPCIMDIKMGTSSVGDDATPEKRANMEKKDKMTTSVSLGIRIIAMKVFQTKTQDYKLYDKPWGKKVTPDAMLDSLKNYFDNGEEVRKELIDRFIELIKKIQTWMSTQKEYRFFSSSLLFIYDGVKPTDGKELKVNIKLIDFAHVHPIKDGGSDEGYLFGLKNLMEHLQKIKG
jgi:hypothetical protein